MIGAMQALEALAGCCSSRAPARAHAAGTRARCTPLRALRLITAKNSLDELEGDRLERSTWGSDEVLPP